MSRSWVSLVLITLLGLTACGAGTNDAAGDEFVFVSPGGQTTLFYDPPHTRGKVPQLGGEKLLEPGTRVGVSDFLGEVVVLNVWGSWCGPCRAEMPDLQRVADQTESSGVQFLGINVRDGRRSAPTDFVRNFGIRYPSIYDPSGRSLLALKGYPRSVVPSTIVLDRQHRVAAVFLTELSESDLLPVVRRIAAESGPVPEGPP